MKHAAIVLFVLFPFFLFAQQNSVLSGGNWYKIFVEETGVYQLTYDDLSGYGMDVDNIDPRHLALYGHPAGMLPESMEGPYVTDPEPVAIKVIGEEDGSFDPEDYVLFFGQAPGIWQPNLENGTFHYVPDLYSDKTFYFLTVGEDAGKRLETEFSTEDAPSFTPDYYDLRLGHNEDLVNPGKTGKIWLGEDFSDSDTLTFVLETADRTMLSDSVYFRLVVAARCSELSELKININRELYKTLPLPVSADLYTYYKGTDFDSTCEAGSTDTRLTLIFNRPNDSAQVWLDYFEFGFRQLKQFNSTGQMSFCSVKSAVPGEITEFSLADENPELLHIWNVTDPLNVKEIVLATSESSVTFRLPTDSLLEFHAFDGQVFYTPGFSVSVDNQNLHACSPPDLLIIAHPDFLAEARQLADFHEENDAMTTAVYTPEQVYNEFSAGKQDITAIRNFVRYLYEQTGAEENPDYLLLFGDASYDYKDRVVPNTNFVPVYESHVSANAVQSFASDRFFGLQDMDDPYGSSELPVAVGRIPVKTTEEANTFLNKLQTYYSPEALGAWKNEFLFIGDDGDNNLHMEFTDALCDTANSLAPVSNITKCYLGFYEPVETEEGPTNPGAEELIDEQMNAGVFFVNYSGHGGATQLAHEGVVNNETVAAWTNGDYLPLWLTAAGGVVHFDDPDVVSLAEQIMLMNGGGSIGFIGNTRPAFAHVNFALNRATLNELVNPAAQPVRMGDLIKKPGNDVSSGKWALLGDPAMRINFPEFDVCATTLNGTDIGDYTDTLLPGERITLEGFVTSKTDSIVIAGFNGTVYLKIYAPPYLRNTLGNQGDPVMEVVVQDSVLAEATAEVVNGTFEISTRLPAFYYERFGLLKLSWYAENGETDAHGYHTGPVFGGEPSGIDEPDEFANRINVYPSPFTDYLTIQMPAATSGPIGFAVYSLMGAQVYSGQFDGKLTRVRIDLQHVSKGLYMLRVGNDQFRKSFKIVKN